MPPLEVAAENLLKAVRTAPKGSAQGVMGWRYEHLSFLLPPDRTVARGRQAAVLSMGQDLVAGKASPEVLDLLACGRCFALRKNVDGSKIRPIMVGDVVRRWITRAVLLEKGEPIEKHLGVRQYAVHIADGCARLYHMVWTALQLDKSAVFLRLDAQNAFNTADRQQIMDEVYTHFPEIYTFLMFFYGSRTPTFFQKDTGETKVIFSEEGVQQGDVMGPTLFCIGLKPVLDRLSERLREQHRSKSTFIGTFMDDVGLIFPSGGLSRAWAAAEEEFRSFNLKLNLGKDKSLAFSPAWVETERYPETSPAGLELLKDRFKLGGGAIGKWEYEKKYFEEVRDEAVGLAFKVANYRDPQEGWLLFRFCVLPKLGFLLRLMTDAIPTSMWQAADDMLLKKCTQGLGIAENEWTLHQTVQASLPLSQGGLGIHRYSLMQKCALVGCYASCLADVLKRLLVQGYANNPDEMSEKVSREGWSQKAQETFYRL
uniref:Reverse transcriptase domain-containing protein n=1 Tax=Chromera velia CCMP2878 TaxID=1169474 RepID=A0A0G4I9I0_9ALVE|eukprot:Cvel_12247.t1-p1 / transcript=Cvel_12247.t1 / gene=Cvel_12247 / organism=Chromera_velia_CCMP2878 / gene_product=Retrotransposable element SLACS 132 kDa protein, putative / transcript_product=Retrotransposable element SLACS 132 kDa protein, putative / location=Cvel_scaffold793:22773-24221(-) / protein_length=483 / sequence_SO=supercontig / SO=protein_coding / is_pseudo=false